MSTADAVAGTAMETSAAGTMAGTGTAMETSVAGTMTGAVTGTAAGMVTGTAEAGAGAGAGAGPAARTRAVAPAGATEGPARRPGAVRAWSRLLVSETGLIFRRPRNVAMLAVLALVPVLLGVALRLFGGPDEGEAGGGGAIFAQIAGNGLFLTFAALALLAQLMLPVAVAVVAGDGIAGEAGGGTLRYLLTAPAGRTRLLTVKYAGAVLFSLAAVALVALSALLTGLALFPVGPITLLSGTTIPFAEGVLRIGVVVLYATAGMAALAAVSLALSTLTEVAVGAIAATVVLVIAAQVVGAIPQLSGLQPYLLTHWWGGFDGVLRDPVATAEMGQGLLVFAAYTAIFGSVAWARFTSRDVTA